MAGDATGIRIGDGVGYQQGVAGGELLAAEQGGDELLELGDMHVVFLFWEKTWGAAVNK